MENYILEALAFFQYLTAQQFQRILPTLSISTINRYLRGLRTSENPLIRRLSFGFAPAKWPLAPVYYLTAKGWQFLISKLNKKEIEVKRPLGRSCFYSADYYHRVATINFKIVFMQWLKQKGYHLNFFHCYFEREGGNNTLSGITSKSCASLQVGDIQIIPDAVIWYTTQQWSEILVFEQHMWKDVKRAIKQIQRHCRALSVGAVNKKYGSQKNSTIIYVFENEACMKSVIKRLNETKWFSNFEHYFWFKTMDANDSSLFG